MCNVKPSEREKPLKICVLDTDLGHLFVGVIHFVNVFA